VTIFETVDRDGDRFTAETETYVEGVAVTVSVHARGYIDPMAAYLTAEEVDALRDALAPYGTQPEPVGPPIAVPEGFIYKARLQALKDARAVMNSLAAAFGGTPAEALIEVADYLLDATGYEAAAVVMTDAPTAEGACSYGGTCAPGACPGPCGN
jgi:hypothetical protein